MRAIWSSEQYEAQPQGWSTDQVCVVCNLTLWQFAAIVSTG